MKYAFFSLVIELLGNWVIIGFTTTAYGTASALATPSLDEKIQTNRNRRPTCY